MSSLRETLSSSKQAPRRFETTRWSVVLAARSVDSVSARDALARLYQDYWYPLYAYLRRDGHDRSAAEDLLQAYFVRLIEKRYLDDVRPEAGKFRSFLLVTLRHFVSDQRKHEAAQKRGGHLHAVSLDTELAEKRFNAEPVDHLTAEKLFEHRWALTVLERVLDRLRRSYEAAGKGLLFTGLETVITGEEPKLRYHDVATRLDMSEGAVKVAAHRLRKRFGEHLRSEIAETLADPEDVDGEIRHLLSVPREPGTEPA